MNTSISQAKDFFSPSIDFKVKKRSPQKVILHESFRQERLAQTVYFSNDLSYAKQPCKYHANEHE